MHQNHINSSQVIKELGSSDKRNLEYAQNFSAKRFFDNLVSSKNPIIFDVGAHKGESINFFRSLYETAKIYSFEPEPENFSILSLVAMQANTHAFNFAIGDRDENAAFYSQSISHLGSLLPINRQSTDSISYANNASNHKIIVKKVMLDTFCSEHSIPHIDILKIDVQGFEVAVLKGAKSILAHTDCATIEVSLYDFYDGNKSGLLNIEQLMNEANFELWDIYKISKNPKNLRTDWMELVYKKIKKA
jgi:FkbM family methyltransferase